MSGRHASPDPVTVALGAVWTAGAAGLLTLLAVVAQEPGSYSLTAAAPTGPVPVPAPDQLPPVT